MSEIKMEICILFLESGCFHG